MRRKWYLILVGIVCFEFWANFEIATTCRYSRYSQIYNITCPGTIGEVAGQILKKELKRLSFVRRRYLKNSERKMAKISELELDSITKYHKALVDAFTHALKSVEAVKQKRNIGTMAG